MPAVVVEVAEAMVTSLEAISFSDPVVIRRKWGDVNDDLASTALREIIVDVVPWSFVPDMDTTHRLAYDQTFDIFIRRTLTQDEQIISQGELLIEEVDRPIAVLQQIWEHFTPEGASGGELVTESSYSAKYDPNASRVMMLWNRPHLRQRQYTGWLRIGYHVSKEVS